MFGYLRLFLLLSLIIVVSGAVTGGMYLNTLAQRNMLSMLETNQVSISQAYVHTVWKRYREALAPLMQRVQELKTNPQVPYFAQATADYFKPLPLLKANIYTPFGVLLVSADAKGQNRLQGATTTPDKTFIIGMPPDAMATSQLLFGVPLNGRVESGTVAQVVVPVRAEGAPLMAKPEIILELLFDASDAYDKLESAQVTGTCVVIFFFVLFLFGLARVARKAEVIIAKQHETNIELAKTAAAAQAENADKSQFLANISHELRTPLNAIIGFSDIIKNELLPTLEVRKYDQYVSDIHASGVHLLSLINDILDFSKAEAGKLALEVSEADVTKLVQNSMRLVGPRAESAGVKLVDAMPKDHIIMVIDSKKFKQVLLNLLSNAVKFTHSGGSVTVSAWENLADNTITFQVEDTGIGIAPKDISRAMAPFGQVDNTLKRKYEGTGLGLPLTKKFVEIMGGKFMIESELEKGTKVIFTLPRAPQEIDGVTVKNAS